MSLGTLILYNGEITKNQIAKGSGAGVYVDGGNFTCIRAVSLITK